jgi:low affinity Fe/Cu permease
LALRGRKRKGSALPACALVLGNPNVSTDVAVGNGVKLVDFGRIARKASETLGSPMAFVMACGVVALWVLSGPVFHFSDTWQLIINTGTTIVTFLMVFLVQHTQNRDARALHLKLDELLRSGKDARNRLINLEDCTDEEMDRLRAQFEKISPASR